MNKDLIMVNGSFDLLHAGHLHFLQSAKMLGIRLLVAVNTDESIRRRKGEGRPIIRLAQRVQMLNAVRWVDEVCAFDTEEQLERIIAREQPAIYVTAGYDANITGADIVRSYGGQVVEIQRLPDISTGDIIGRIQNACREIVKE